MRAWFIAMLPAILLAACGGGDSDDVVVEIKRPVTVVYAPLMAADAAEARIAFPGVGFERSRPNDGEILYTIPGTGSFPATVRFRLEGKDGGETTLVHASVKVPKVRAVIEGKPMELSESKVERHLEGLLKSTGSSLEMGSGAQSESRKLSSLLLALAVATNEKHLARALDLKNNPAKLMELLLAFDDGSGGSKQPEPDVNGREIRSVDPDAAEQRREFAQMEAEWKRDEALDRAAAPTTDLGSSSGGYDSYEN